MRSLKTERRRDREKEGQREWDGGREHYAVSSGQLLPSGSCKSFDQRCSSSDYCPGSSFFCLVESHAINEFALSTIEPLATHESG